MKRWQWAVLLLELALMALILVLPQVDLPDFLSHGVTTPVAVKVRISAPPVHAFRTTFQVPFPGMMQEKLSTGASTVTSSDLSSRLSTLCSRLC